MEPEIVAIESADEFFDEMSRKLSQTADEFVVVSPPWETKEGKKVVWIAYRAKGSDEPMTTSIKDVDDDGVLETIFQIVMVCGSLGRTMLPSANRSSFVAAGLKAWPKSTFFNRLVQTAEALDQRDEVATH